MQHHHCQCRVKIKRYRHTRAQTITANNIMNRNFKAHRPLEKLVTDITYIPFGSKMLYLSPIMDLYNGEIIAYTLRDKQDVSSVLDTLNQLPDIHESCILHSDQGSSNLKVYCFWLIQKYLAPVLLIINLYIVCSFHIDTDDFPH